MDDHHPESMPVSNAPAPARSAPPTDPGAIPTQSAKWPTVIGVLAIIFASVILLMEALGAVIAPWMQSLAAQHAPQHSPPPTTRTTPAGWAMLAVSITILLLHFVGGVQTIRRVRIGPRMLLWFAWADIALTVASAAWAAVAAATTANVQNAAGPLGIGFVIAMMLFSMSFKLIWPVILLIFLSRHHNRALWQSWP